jgi:glyoxylase-like metal-dependent hydrolase (beta-lactamase superfamily II)
MYIQKFINSIFNSNTYILSNEESNKVYVIDPGDSEPLFAYINDNNKTLAGIFLTHSHFDHIYGVNDLLLFFPETKLFASFYAKVGIFSEKLNGSLYKEMPFVVDPFEVSEIAENDVITLWKDTTLKVIETPGHDRDCVSFFVGNNIFTGDSLIPGIKVFTKFKYSDKQQAAKSINKVIELSDDESVIWPGHENSCFVKNLLLESVQHKSL